MAECWGLVFVACDRDSAGYSIAKTANAGGVVESNGGGGAAFEVMYTGHISTTVLGDVSLPTCAAAGFLLLLFC